jgi:hypothetical protein
MQQISAAMTLISLGSVERFITANRCSHEAYRAGLATTA